MERSTAVEPWSPPSSAPASAPATHQPALDGIRAIAVGLVLVFHLDVGYLPGGYLGVSVFFTLSGFLITRILLNEHSTTGSVALGRFYQRRLRRLLPASMLTLASVVLLVRLGVFASSDRLRTEISASALQSMNIAKLFDGSSYADLFRAPSPVAHFWSLGIEEQFYWVWPIALLAIVRHTTRRARGPLVSIAVLFAVSSVAAVVTAQISPSAAYYAPWSRAAEILAGALFATWLSTHRPATWWRHLPAPALVAIVVACATTPSGRGWAYQGALPLFALVSVALIAGVQADGRISRSLSWRPLVLLGVVSYGVYLVHWPVFVALDEQRTGWSGTPLTVLRLSVTLALAAVMYTVVEQPIRTPQRTTTLRPVAVSALAATVALFVGSSLMVQPAPSLPVAARVLAAPLAQPDAESEVEPRQATASRLESSHPEPADDVTAPTRLTAPAPSEYTPLPSSEAFDATKALSTPTVIGIFGDSVPAWLLRDAAASFDRADATLVNVANEACDAMAGLPVGRDRRLEPLVAPSSCQPWTTEYPRAIAESGLDLDIAVLVLGQAPTVDRYVGDRWMHPCEGIGWYLDDLDGRVDYLRWSGTEVVFALPARPGERARFVLADDATQRFECVREQLQVFLDERFVRTIDLDDILCVDDDCDRLRSADGTHVDPDEAHGVLDWLVSTTLVRSY